MDRDLRYIRINARLAEMNGLPAADHIGRTGREVLPDLADKSEEQLKQILQTGKPVIGIELTGEIPREPGVQHTWIESWLPLFDEQGEVAAINIVVQEITERKIAEERIRLQANILRQINDAVITVDLQERITYLNAAAAGQYAVDPNAVLGRPLTALHTHQWLTQKAEEEAYQELEQNGYWRGENLHIRHDGKEIAVESTVSTLQNTDGEVIGMLAVIRDISERKAAEEALQRSEERYRFLFENVDDGFCIVEMLFDDEGRPLDYRFLEANPSFERHTGLVNAIGKTAREVIPTLEDHWVEIYGAVALTGQPNRFEQGSEAMGRWFDVYTFRIGGTGSHRVAIFFKDITERKQTELALAQNNAILTGVLESNNDAIFVRDLTGRYLLVNSAGAEQVGMRKEAIVGKNYRELFTSAEVTTMTADDRPVLEEGVTQTMEHTSEQHGVIRHWHTLKMPLRNEDGAITGLVSSARDMTERIRAEEELRRAYEILALAQRVSQSGVWDWDIAHDYTFWSAEYYDLYGIPPETAPGHDPWIAAIHPDDRARIERRLHEVLHVDGDWNEEFRITHPERGERWLVGIGQVAYDEAGSAARFTGVNLDITERKAAEAQLRHQAYLLENVQDAIISTDLEFRIQTWNRGAEEIYGWSAAEAIGQRVYELLATTYADTDADPDIVRNAFLTTGRWQGEVIQADKNGHRLFISNITVLLRNEVGEPTGAVAANRDITERKQAEERLRFLVEASAILASSLDYNRTLENVAHAAVANIADWCAIDLARADGAIESAALAHIDPEKVRWAEELRARYPVDPNAPAGAPNVIRTGVSEFYPEITDAMLAAVAKNDEELHLLRSVGYRSIMVVPLQTRDQILGAISFVATERQHRFTEADLRMAEDLARRAAASIENAQLYQSLQQRQAELRASAQHLRNILDNLAAFVGVMTPDGTLIEANRTALKAADLAPTDVLGKHFAETYWWSYNKAIQAQLRDAIARAVKGEILRYDVQVRLGEERFIMIDFMLAPIYNEAGEVSYLIPSGVDVTERRLMEGALRQSEERLRLATTAGGIGIFDHDLIRGEIDYSAIYRALTGFAEAEESPTREKWLVRVHPDDRALVEEKLQRARAFGESYQIEYRILHPDQSVHWLAVSALVTTDSNGRGVRITGAVRDITARKEASEALRRSEAQFRAVQQATPDGFMIFESVRDGETDTIVDFRWLYVNPAAEKIMGRTHRDLVGKLLLEEMPGNRDEGLFDAYVEVVASGEVWQREFLYSHDGLDHWFRSTAAKTGDGFAVAFSDITANKAAEEALRRSEVRFRSAFEQAAVGMAHLDIEGHYVRVNDRLCEILGYTREELLGKGFAEITHPDDLEIDLTQTARQLRGELHHHIMEKRYLRKDGSYIWANMTASIVFDDDDGTPQYGIVVVEDISSRKKAEQDLYELTVTLEERVAERTAELERSNRELDQFAYVASHDLRAPLRGINHLVDWISEDADDLLPATSQKHLATLRGRVHRMEQLLEDLLIYSRAGRQPSQIEVVESDKLVTNLIELLQPEPPFRITIASAMPTFTTRRVPLELVLRNLINNAIKHHHRADGHVHVTAREVGEWVEFTVQDDGPGIDPAFHERIFQIFQTLQPRDEVEGSGMGLAVVKKTVEAMGGKIWVESAEGEGATFGFTWPKLPTESDE